MTAEGLGHIPPSLPEILSSPPWRREIRQAEPTVVANVEVADEPMLMVWLAGERERFARHDHRRALLAVEELTVAPMLIELAKERPTELLGAVLPLGAPALAPIMADAYGRLRSVRADAAAWFDRHPRAAIIGLIALAVGPVGKARAHAELALRYVDRADEVDVRSIVAEVAPAASAAIVELLDIDPIDVLPAKIPSVPDFVDVELLPAPDLRNNGGALPVFAVTHVVTMWALSTPDHPYPGLALVEDACEPASLAECAWGVFAAWCEAGHPTAQSWALTSLGHVGDDETVRRLSPLIRAWPGARAHKRAVSGLDVLQTIGSDVALMHLSGIAQRVRFRGVKRAANERIDAIATELGLSRDQLADRLVPDLGLDRSGSLALDYGDRAFQVRFDESLIPFVVDGDGKRRKGLPKPGQKDDPVLALVSFKRFAALKKDARNVARNEIARLEQAMVFDRRWSAEEFTRHLVGHPFLVNIVRRLVWNGFDSLDRTSFRVAEDRSFADRHDDVWVLPDAAQVGLAHPIELDEAELADWTEIFDDYELLQPFEQLHRVRFTLAESARSCAELPAPVPGPVPVGRILGLESRGWERGPVLDNGISADVRKRLAGGYTAIMGLDGGLVAGAVMESGEQWISEIWITDQPTDYFSPDDAVTRFEVLPEVAISELLRDLASLVPAESSSS